MPTMRPRSSIDPWQKTLLSKPAARSALHVQAEARGIDPEKYLEECLLPACLALVVNDRKAMMKRQRVRLGKKYKKGPDGKPGRFIPPLDLSTEEFRHWIQEQTYKKILEALLGTADIAKEVSYETLVETRQEPFDASHGKAKGVALRPNEEEAALLSLLDNESESAQKSHENAELFGKGLQLEPLLMYWETIKTPREEVARMLGISRAAVDTRISRLRKKVTRQ